MFERFTERARGVVVLGQEQLRELGWDVYGSDHLLLGLLAVRKGIGPRVLADQGVTLKKVRKLVGRCPRDGYVRQVPFSPHAKKALEMSLMEALKLGAEFVDTEHILLGLLADGESEAAVLLREQFGVTDAIVRPLVVKRVRARRRRDAPPKPTTRIRISEPDRGHPAQSALQRAAVREIAWWQRDRGGPAQVVVHLVEGERLVGEELVDMDGVVGVRTVGGRSYLVPVGQIAYIELIEHEPQGRSGDAAEGSRGE